MTAKRVNGIINKHISHELYPDNYFQLSLIAVIFFNFKKSEGSTQ